MSTPLQPDHQSEGTIIQGDCLTVLRGLPANSVDAMVTDPPCGIAFMGKSWDSDKGGRKQWIAWLQEVMQEALRVIKPGGHAFVWALPRTSHWTATALEDAGFEIRDVITHLFGSGFPKSHHLENGQGSALKPSNEHWILCRKPLAASTIAKNVLAWGTGGLAVEASRIAAPDHPGVHTSFSSGLHEGWDRPWRDGREPEYKPTPPGRFPSNTLLSHTLMCVEEVTAWECDPSCPIFQLDEQSGMRKNGVLPSHQVQRTQKSVFGKPTKYDATGRVWGGDTGGASRYFAQFHPTEEDIVPFLYCSKASRTERNQGCEGLPEGSIYRAGHGKNEDDPVTQRFITKAQNTHPTVKPLALCRYLITMITPPDGIVLDPFAGSGSTLVACVQTGHRFIGIEQDEGYCSIARARIAHAERETS